MISCMLREAWDTLRQASRQLSSCGPRALLTSLNLQKADSFS
jgi:hypothetical protein